MAASEQSPAMSAQQKYGACVRFHLDRGTRPEGQTKVWQKVHFADKINKSVTTVDNLCNGTHLPPRPRIIEYAILGDKDPDDSGQYADWRRELRTLYDEAELEA